MMIGITYHMKILELMFDKEDVKIKAEKVWNKIVKNNL